jgi:protein TonB
MKRLLFAIALFIGNDIVAQNNIEVESHSEEKIPENTYSFNTVEKKPTLNGNENGFLKFVFENIQYPEKLKKEKIEGMVYVSFTVSDEAKVKNIKIHSSDHELFSKEVIRLINISKKWEAGEQNEKKANVVYTLPINFKLN